MLVNRGRHVEVVRTAIPDVKILVPLRHVDHRGFFSETWNRLAFEEAGIPHEFVQDNQSLSVAKGTLRGLHFQVPPYAQHKLVRVVHGAILDVAVDLRRGSPTFGKHVTAEISADAWNQIFVPIGFAHGYCTLVPNTQIIYKVSCRYAPDHERGLLWNDPALDIDWPVSADEAAISDRDRQMPLLSELTDLFE